MQHALYLLSVAALALAVPEYYFDPRAAEFILVIGTVAVWRYSWAINHYCRALYYTRRVFPSMRARADALGEEGKPAHAFFLITSFRIGSETSARVYRAVVREAIACGVPSTIIASVVEMADERLVKQMFHALKPPRRVALKLVRIAGTGKRDGLAAGMRAISSSPVHLENTLALVIDGDTILTPGLTAKCFPLFKLNPRLGALTTDEECTLDGGRRVRRWHRHWYNLRFAQRTVYMSSLALSRRVLTLTGRMSMFRGDIIGDSEFIDRVEFDHIDHWRLGRFRFLTGDDKSTWYQVLKEGWEMTYVPDARVLTIEEPPERNFLKGATVLMRRWFGNMLRTNARALKLPRRTIGTFTWWCLIDQRLTMWTSLFGLSIALLGSLKVGGSLLLAFILWILMTRYLLALGLAVFHKRFSASWPLLLYFNQIYGSLIKIYMLTHLNKQSWTRQKTKLASRHDRWHETIEEFGSTLAWAVAMLVFLTPIAMYVGLLTMTDLHRFVEFLGGGF